MSNDPSRYGISRGQVSPEEQAEAERDYQRQQKQESRFLTWARQRGLSAAQAQRFLTRQRAARAQRQRRQAVLPGQLPGHAAVLCCDTWMPIVQTPLRCLRCGTVYFARVPAPRGQEAV
jgi:hypothetical protein